ncbi:MAG: hypothetical protein NTY02_01855 [Acidobacteria bacterium]|nr:hypothetical protein [Acidobacteriota bacterium]
MAVHAVSKTRFVLPVLLMAVSGLLLATPSALYAQSVTLSLSQNSFSFASADPDSTPTITGSPAITVTYSVSGTKSGGGWTMTLLAGGNLIAGTATIPISNMTWTATPKPVFQDGMMSNSLAQTLASGLGNKSNSTGMVTFSLANSWSYNVGTYTASIIFTITAY